MTRVMVGKHLLLNMSRRSLCDNCIAEVCIREAQGRVLECAHHRAPFLAFKKCSRCGKVFEVYSNLRRLKYEMCSSCNDEEVLG